MSENAIMAVSYEAERAIAKPKGKNYAVQCGSFQNVELKRGVDFGVIPKTKKPSLFKSGAEKICMGYGLLQQYELVQCDSTYGKEPFFRYLFKCNLVKDCEIRNKILRSMHSCWRILQNGGRRRR